MDSQRRFLVLFVVILISLQFAACTRTSTKSTQTTTDTSDDTGTTSGFGEEDSSNSTFTSSSNTGNMGNLFNSDLDDQEVNQSSQLTNTNLTASTQSCLSNSAIAYDDEYQGTQLNNAGSCLASNAQAVPAQQFYDTSLKALNGQEICIARAMMVGPQSEADAEAGHMRGRMEMLRCFRELAGNMQNAIPWSTEQNGVYNNYIQNMNRMVYRAKNGQF